MRVLALLVPPLLILSATASAATDVPVGSGCFAMAAQRYSLDETLLRAVAKVESNFAPGAIHFDTDGTHDVGVMQINSSHFADLQRRWRVDERTLLEHPCVNVFVGASILADFVNRFGPTWRAVGSYGAGMAPQKEAARAAYAALVSRALARLSATARHGSVQAFAVRSPDAPVRLRMLVLE